MFHKRGVVRKFDGRLDSVFFKNPPSLCLVWYAGHLITDHFAYIHHPSPNFPHNEYSKVKLSDLRLMWKPFQLLKEILKSLEKKSLESWIKLQTYWIVLLFLHPLRGGIMSKNTTDNISTIHILTCNYNKKHIEALLLQYWYVLLLSQIYITLYMYVFEFSQKIVVTYETAL